MFRRTLLSLCFYCSVGAPFAQELYHEQYRPQIHFSPQENWMNDPNGMIFFHGFYHLFFQYYPDSTVWGPMHWGHAVSPDLVHWKQAGIALYPDSLGYIFSGSAIADETNTSGFGAPGQVPLVAAFTQHDPAGEKAGTNHFQNQSIAYSLDAGNSWKKFKGNPVLKTPGLKDFRDPKIFWYAEQKKWIMTLAAGDRIMFYSSADLKNWKKESEFGSRAGAHGGVWECPDLIRYNMPDQKVWLLIVNMNPGGIQGGSGTQYFTGSFDGHQFTPFDTITRWADYGPDNYAGVTFSNTGTDKIFLGWMSNWQYGTKVPTERWRSAMTIPRELGIKKIKGAYYTTMVPVKALQSLVKKSNYYLNPAEEKTFRIESPARIELTTADLHSFSVEFSNGAGQTLIAGYDDLKNSFFIDRRRAGKSDFDSAFARIHFGPRIAETKNSNVIMILDNASLELFADGGLTTMTEICFPDTPYNDIRIHAGAKNISGLKISNFTSIW